MKSFTTLALIILTVLSAEAQNKSVGIGIVSPNQNAALHVVSPTGNQGLLIPQLTTSQRNSMALGVAEKGMLVFDTNQNALYIWNGNKKASICYLL